jgi:hypothetical protein
VHEKIFRVHLTPGARKDYIPWHEFGRNKNHLLLIYIFSSLVHDDAWNDNAWNDNA